MLTKEKNTSEPEQTNVGNLDNSSKIEAIKNLIFGKNILEYNSEFDKIKQDILNKRKELKALIEDVRVELIESIDNLNTDVNIRITDLETSMNNKVEDLDEKKLDRRILGNLLVNLGNKISKE